MRELLYGSYYSEEETDYFLEGDTERNIPSLLEYVYEETGGINEVESKEAWESILSAMGFYIDDYPATNAYRQKIWERFNVWLYNIAFELEQKYDETFICQIMPKPIIGDLDIEIMKDLHYSKTGVSKKRLAQKYHVSERTVKETLNKLDRNDKTSELRIAGQKVSIDLKYEDTCDGPEYWAQGRRYRYFHSASTINPIFLQLNIAEVHSLINGLKCSYYQEERDMSISTGVEIWSQLSEYTKDRIRLVYATKDEELSDFLMILDDELQMSTHAFHSEREQLNEQDLSDYERDEIERKLSM